MNIVPVDHAVQTNLMNLLRKASPNKTKVYDAKIVALPEGEKLAIDIKRVAFMSLLHPSISNAERTRIYNQWQRLPSFIKYDKRLLQDRDPDLYRSAVTGETSLAPDTKVGPVCFRSFSDCLASVKPNSFVYVGVFTGTFIEGSSQGTLLPTERDLMFRCGLLISLRN